MLHGASNSLDKTREPAQRFPKQGTAPRAELVGDAVALLVDVGVGQGSLIEHDLLDGDARVANLVGAGERRSMPTILPESPGKYGANRLAAALDGLVAVDRARQGMEALPRSPGFSERDL